MTDADRLTPRQRALLADALRRRRGQADGIARRSAGRPVALSSAQRRMWFFWQWQPASPTFNAARAIRLRGVLDQEALHRALRTIVERHEALRTVVAPASEPVQRVLEEWALPLPMEILGDGGSEGTLEARLRELAREPFDLTGDLMLRANLIRLASTEHVLLLRLHHMAGDAHSDTILFAELSELYDAYHLGRGPVLAPLGASYADFTLWQNERLSGSWLEELVSYWRSELQDAPLLLPLPIDHPRPAVQRHVGAHRRLEIERALAERLIELARPEGATFFMAALAVFGTLLYLRTGADDIVLGSPIANRNHVDIHHTVGFFSNTIVLRLRLGGNPSFQDVLHRVRQTALGAYAHQELPFEQLVQTLAPKRDPSHNPIFQVNFRAQVAPRGVLELTGLDSELIPVDIGFSRFDLALELELGPASLTGYLEYSEDLFEPDTADGLIEDLHALLEQVVADPHAPVLALALPRRTRGSHHAPIARRRRG